MLPINGIERLFHEKIPLTRAMGVRVESYDGDTLILTAPLEPNHNHLNTAFGGSLQALAILSCYGWLWLELQDEHAHIVIRESTVTYRRPVRGILRASCSRPEKDAIDTFKANFSAKRKARLVLKAIMMESEEVAVELTGEFVALIN